MGSEYTTRDLALHGAPALPLFAALLLSCVLSCASIQSFDARPRNACEGDAVIVSWQATGRVSLRSLPDLPDTVEVPEAGSRSFAVTAPTRFELEARGAFGDASAEAEIDVAPQRHTFGEIASCASEGGSLRAVMQLDTQLSPAFRIASVDNVLSREIGVEKDGRTAHLAPGAQSAALSGLPVLGEWILTSPLSDGETCDATLRSIRQRLRVQIHLVCGG